MTEPIPEWLNPAVLPPADLVERMHALAAKFKADIQPARTKFVHDANLLLAEYRSSNQPKRPDDVSEAIEEAAGVNDLVHALYLLRSEDDDESGF